MSIKQKLEQAQASSLSKVVFEITADELIEFVKQVSNVSSMYIGEIINVPRE